MKLPRDLTGPEVTRALERLGFTKARQRGSHIRMVRGEVRVTVPAHGAIPPGTLKSILRQAGIDGETLLAAL